MIVVNPEVTLDVEAHGIPEGPAPAGFLDWMLVAPLRGDDGKQYQIGPIAMSLKKEQIDMVMVKVVGLEPAERAKIYQLPDSIYKVAEFTETPPSRSIYPAGSLTIKKSEHEVLVDVGDLHIRIKDDKTWYYDVEDKKEEIRIQVTHHGVGYPTWYGRPEEGKPAALTTHSIAYGYFWSGVVEGTLTIKGKKINVKGKGVRERYIAVDTSPAEIGGWEDWIWFHFDEMFGSLYEFKYGTKDMSLYLVDGKQYFPVVKFDIIHSEWAYLKQAGVFIPTHYKIIAQTEAGTLEFDTNVIGGFLAGSTGKVPDAPVFTFFWDKLEGTFTYKDGRVKKLTNGLGSTSVRCWKPYPNIIPPALATEMPKPSVHPMSAME
jgi:hypothetical protein